MYNGKQVMRFVNNIKSKSLYNIGNELDERKGTGNYDLERTKYNIQYIPLNNRNMYQEVKEYLDNNNIEYLHKTKTNMLNGVVFTSGPEFFQNLGMKFKKTERTRLDGSSVYVPDIKSKDDIPKKVLDYFDSCMEFLENKIGKDKIIRASIHFDEDTPHLHAYFVPVVHEVKRKCYQRDINGNLIKDENNKPILLRDKNNKIVYETVKGNFLNNDQFWKDLGGNLSFAKLQDEFNLFINERGFNLDRGKIGSNKHHTDKIEYQMSLSNNKLNKVKKDIELQNKRFDELTNNVNKIFEEDKDINIKKLGPIYKNKDVEDLIKIANNLKYYSNLQQDYKKDAEEQKNFKDMYRREVAKLNNDSERKNDIIDKLSSAIGILKFGHPISFNNANRIAGELSSIKHINDEMDKAAEEFYSHKKDNGMEI